MFLWLCLPLEISTSTSVLVLLNKAMYQICREVELTKANNLILLIKLTRSIIELDNVIR
ncbi:hypothetical protein XCR1_1900008 [Xenorhabdus cabanillasii JM26]|uniref:Uncharacterized protein n=1 Tax=Xenorhabdus cabanillasii JM26 TaxID=1427517 RepID=W1J4I0_9GAMM|nr:hypothetical protein XCR1_1900008 [Xenorhabdus cabanillasii JM26]